MEFVSAFDIFKIGVGPSSSHTLGPWKAGLDFLSQIKDLPVSKVSIDLFGSLSKTGKGHGTDIAVQLGLLGYDPITIDTRDIQSIIFSIKDKKQLSINGIDIIFDPETDINFHKTALEYHPNALKFNLILEDNSSIERTYYSIGGGFIECHDDQHLEESSDQKVSVPYPIETEKELRNYIEETGLPIWQIVLHNELAFGLKSEIVDELMHIWETMEDCIFRGCSTDGILPGGLFVERRALRICKSLLGIDIPREKKDWIKLLKEAPNDFDTIGKWISCFALAVNEENAAFGRVVTSPTNGAAGIIPAVLMYLKCFTKYNQKEDIVKFLLTASEIGSLFKKGATISAAAGGCQAEVGVSAAMAAAGLAEVKGANPYQVLMAAEIAMEHHLGLTCDPIGGLVQIPCIERNAIGAMKAITSANLALSSDHTKAKVNLDSVINTMWETAKDMNVKYRETSEGGLALTVLNPVIANC